MNALKTMSPAQACIIGLVIAGLLFFFVFGGDGSLAKSMKPLKNKKIQLENDIKAKDSLIKRAVIHQKHIKNLGNTINKVVKYITKDMRSAKMMRNLTDSAKISGVNIIDVSNKGRISRKRGDASELYDKIPVSIKLEGNFTQIMMFLSNLTKLENIITVENLSIETGKSLSEGIVSFSAVFVGYRYKDQDQAVNL